MHDHRGPQDTSFSWPPPASDLASTDLIDLQTSPPTLESATASPARRAVISAAPTGTNDHPAVGPRRFAGRAARASRRVGVGRRGSPPPWGWLAAGLLLGAVLPGPKDTAPPTRLGVASTLGLTIPTMEAAAPAPPNEAPAATSPAPMVLPAAAAPAGEATAPPARSEARRRTRAATPGSREILGTVEAFGTAWSRLDADGTRRVWPGADRAVLQRTFNGLREQRLTLDGCAVSVADDEATARCAGTLRYRPRVGDHSTRTRRGRWAFDLERKRTGWVITDVTSPG